MPIREPAVLSNKRLVLTKMATSERLAIRNTHVDSHLDLQVRSLISCCVISTHSLCDLLLICHIPCENGCTKLHVTAILSGLIRLGCLISRVDVFGTINYVFQLHVLAARNGPLLACESEKWKKYNGITPLDGDLLTILFLLNSIIIPFESHFHIRALPSIFRQSHCHPVKSR